MALCDIIGSAITGMDTGTRKRKAYTIKLTLEACEYAEKIVHTEHTAKIYYTLYAQKFNMTR